MRSHASLCKLRQSHTASEIRNLAYIFCRGARWEGTGLISRLLSGFDSRPCDQFFKNHRIDGRHEGLGGVA